MNGKAILKVPVNEHDQCLGPLNAPLMIVQYGDFESPESAMVVRTINRLILEFQGEVTWVYRHFPLQKKHPNAGVAAVAAEAAGRQGKFWEMLEELCQEYENLSGDKVLLIGRKIGLDMKKFLNDLELEHLMSKVNEDIRSGLESGVNMVPTFFFNGTRYNGPPNYADLRGKIIEILGPGGIFNVKFEDTGGDRSYW